MSQKGQPEHEKNPPSKGASDSSMSQVNLDKLLDALGNSTRRIILKKLARFPNEGVHPEDLQYDLGVSRQGIMKHLKILQELDLIEPHEVQSPHQGLTRTNYRLKKDFSLSFDIGSNYFNIHTICDGCETNSLEHPEAQEYGEFLEDLSSVIGNPEVPIEALEKALNDVSAELDDISSKFAELDRKRQILIQYKHALLERARLLANRIQLGNRQWEILNAVLANWRYATQTMTNFQWLFDEIFDDRLKEDRKSSFMRDIEEIFGQLKRRFKFFEDL